MPGLLGQENALMGIDPMAVQAFIQQLGARQANPMQRPIAGEEFLQGLGQVPLRPPGIDPAQGLGLSLGGQDPQQQLLQQPSTDFAGTAPGLPNLPDSYEGFGFGQTAPQSFEGAMDNQQLLREQLIRQLLGQAGAQGILGGF